MFLCGSVLIHTRNDAQRGEEGGGHGRCSRKAEWGRAWSALHGLDRRVGGRERGPLRRPLGARAAEQVFDSPRRASRGNQAAAAHTTRTPAETGRERLAVLDGASKLHHDAANPLPRRIPGGSTRSAMGSMEADGASTESENLMREEQRDTIEPRLNKTLSERER